METGKKRWPRVLAVLLLVILAVSAGVWVSMKLRRKPQGGRGASTPQLTPEEAARIVTESRVAVGRLENDQLAQAEELLLTLYPQAPDEPIITRNLMIVRLLTLLKGGSVDQEGIRQSLESMRRVEPNAPSTFWLVAKTNLKLAEIAADEGQRARYTSEAVANLERAAQSDSDNPVFAFQLYWNTQYHPDQAVVQKGLAALQRAYELRSDNLFILTERLSVQTNKQDPTIADTITRAKRVLAPMASRIEQRTRINVLKMLDQAAQAAAAGEWGIVRRNIAPLMGPVRSEEISQSDARRIDVNPLEFVVHELSPEFLSANPPSPVPVSDVTFGFQPAELGDVGNMLREVRDARIADFDLDDRQDVLVLRSGKLDVYAVTEGARLGPLITSFDVAGDFDRLQIADLDQDTIPQVRSGGPPPDRAAATAPPAAPGAPEPLPAQCFQADGDIVLTGRNGLLVLRNELGPDGTSRSLQPVPQDESLQLNVPVISAVLVDFDHDGDLDVVASTESGIRLWSNRGQLLLEDLSQYSTLPAAELRFAHLAIVDWDRDVDVDVLLSGADATQIGYLENLRHGELRWRPFAEEFPSLTAASAVAPLEADGNVSWDLACVGRGGMRVLLTSTIPASSVRLNREVAVTEAPFSRLSIADFDNDGYRDVLAWGPAGVSLYRGQTEGRFQLFQPVFGDWRENLETCDTADADGDGDVDILAVSNRQLVLLRNEGGHRNSYLKIQCHGNEDSQSGRVNHWAVGSLVEVKAGGMYQAQTVTSGITHFGMGTIKQADVARVLWTQGIPQAIIQPAANQMFCEPMMLKGSCPYVYTWTGERFEFFTDLLWAAPLGLQFADGVIAPDRPWEYLKIPGEQLRPRDGHYELQITEELWEAGYFDQVELLCVDHPEEVEVFSNEKVGPPDIAEFKIHTVRQRLPLAAAHDQRGRDLLPALQNADHFVAQAFDQTLRQGLAEEHYLEFDFGELKDPQKITLFLTGWIRPTDTSLNVAISHDPVLLAPKPPSIWAPDPQGVWREVVPFMGFPGGKMKTIAVDVSRVFTPGDYRLRIVTSNELYWDEAFFTVDEEPVRIEPLALPMVSADLHYRGCSVAIPGPRNLPERYDYAQVEVTPRWPPMRGRFTRYGDVRELLLETDARMVTMGSGDEITVRFAMPKRELPAGWKRDFILHNVGWDKDADLNTVFGQTVEPLPFVGMRSYPYHEQDYPDTELHRRYLREYQTREATPQSFWHLLAP